MKNEIPYNPLDKNNLGASVADALLERSKIDLENVEQFIGAGIYAIYYTGSFPSYSHLVSCPKSSAMYFGNLNSMQLSAYFV